MVAKLDPAYVEDMRLDCSYIFMEHYDPIPHVDGLLQDCSDSIAKALELLQPCTKPLVYIM